MTQKPKIKNWEELINDGDNYGDANYTPLEKTIVESIKNKTVLKIQDSFLFSKNGDIKDPDHGPNLARLLANFEPLKDVTSIIITHNQLGPEGVAILAESPIIKNIDYLHLGSNQLGDEGAKIIANSPLFANVEFLNLECNKIQPAGAKALAESKYLTKVTSLNLVDNKISDEGALCIANSPNFSNLTYLHLGGNRIKLKETKQAVRECKNLSKIETLKIF